jgi:UDP-hydrolysing UDP-N-acetyl-D-glucosamine 2-epimerase
VLNNDHGLSREIAAEGVGDVIDTENPFLMVSQHPVTTEFGAGEKQIIETLEAVRDLEISTIILWPNSDAGSEDISRGIRKFRERYGIKNIHLSKSLSVETYIKLMKRTSCLVGNSSSGIREGAFIGTPVVNIGTRQDRRQRGSNVIDAGYDREEIKLAVLKQLENGKYPSEPIYGDGNAGTRIANILADCPLYVQKHIAY